MPDKKFLEGNRIKKNRTQRTGRQRNANVKSLYGKDYTTKIR